MIDCPLCKIPARYGHSMGCPGWPIRPFIHHVFTPYYADPYTLTWDWEAVCWDREELE